MDKDRNEEEITMEILEQVAQSILKMIKVTSETPCKFIDKKLWVNHEEGGRVDFEFYSKEISNDLVLMADSAMPQDAKRTVLTQKCLRRLRNTKKELGPEVQNEHLSEFLRRMKKSELQRIISSY